MPTTFIAAQSFSIDSSLVQGAAQVFVSSIELFCKYKPAATNNGSGINNPGVNIYIVPMTSGIPVANSTVDSTQIARCNFATISPSIDASQAATFVFTTPVPVNTNIQYCFIVVPDGLADYVFWSVTVGQDDISTDSTISNINYNGNYFELSNQTTWTALAGTELKFNLSIARFFVSGIPVATNDSTYIFRMGTYEFVAYDTLTSGNQFITGEPCFQMNSSYDGTCSVTSGNNVIISNINFSTWYTGSDFPTVIVDNGNGQYNLRQVSIYTGNTAFVSVPFNFTNSAANFWATAPTASIYVRILNERDIATGKNSVVFSGSTANSTYYFSNTANVKCVYSNQTLVNCVFENIIVSDVTPSANIQFSAATSYTVSEEMNYTTSDGFGITFGSNSFTFPIQMNYDNIIQGITVIPSFSSEAATYGLKTTQGSNSSELEITLNSNNDFMIPLITSPLNIPVYFTRYYINDDYTLENTMYGNAVSKEVSSIITLSSGSYAEDVLSWIQGFRPFNTDFKCFVKVYNTTDPDDFVDKDWTLMQINENPTIYSPVGAYSNITEYGYIVPSCPNTDFTFAGVMSWPTGETNVTCSANSFLTTSVNVGDLVKIYSPLFPNNDFMVVSVSAVVNTTVITVDQITANNSISGNGLFMDHIGFRKQAFLNNQNYNIIRYYDSNFAYHDTYNMFAMKVVFLSYDLTTLPFMTSIRTVAVSA